MAGILYVVGTPIGNLEDMSVRAVRTLQEVDFIAAEDTRVTLKLLNHFDIKKPMVSYHDHNIREKGEIIIAKLQAGENGAIVVNNADWLMDLNYVEVLREVGACFSVNNMLRAECYKQRMEKGLSFLEFNYMIMQSYDFYYLYQKYGCNMQFGGDDQWSNMLGGTELIRKKLGKDAYAMTITLLMNSEGKKMGKTAKGAVWLDANKTTPFEFYQYWRNVSDEDVIKCIKMLTFLPVEEIEKMESWQGAELNRAKEILAFELTKLVHGEENAMLSEKQTKAAFGGGSEEDMPVKEIDKSVETVMDVMVLTGLTKSKGEARRLIEGGGVSIGDKKLTVNDFNLTAELKEKGEFILHKGKKVHYKIILK